MAEEDLLDKNITKSLILAITATILIIVSIAGAFITRDKYNFSEFSRLKSSLSMCSSMSNQARSILNMNKINSAELSILKKEEIKCKK